MTQFIAGMREGNHIFMESFEFPEETTIGEAWEIISELVTKFNRKAAARNQPLRTFVALKDSDGNEYTGEGQ